MKDASTNSIIALTMSLILAGLLMLSVANAQGELQAYECQAFIDRAGREEPSTSSPLIRWEDGRLRELEKGTSGYGHAAKDTALPQWIELYGTQSARGNSLLGYFQTKDLICSTYTE